MLLDKATQLTCSIDRQSLIIKIKPKKSAIRNNKVNKGLGLNGIVSIMIRYLGLKAIEISLKDTSDTQYIENWIQWVSVRIVEALKSIDLPLEITRPFILPIRVLE